MNSVTIHGDLFHGEMMPKLLIVLIALSLGTSCSSQPLSEAEIEARDYKRAIDLENWRLCKLAIKQARDIEWHINHTERDDYRHYNIRSDLWENQCRTRLGKYWADY